MPDDAIDRIYKMVDSLQHDNIVKGDPVGKILEALSELRSVRALTIEECAKVAEGHVELSGADSGEIWIANKIASAIRSLPPTHVGGEGEWTPLKYATQLATFMSNKHFPPNPDWRPLPDIMGVLSQIDNMLTALVHKDSALRKEREGAVAWALEFTKEFGVNPRTTFKTREEAEEYAACCSKPAPTVVPLFAHPPAVPEGWRDDVIEMCAKVCAAREQKAFDRSRAPLINMDDRRNHLIAATEACRCAAAIRDMRSPPHSSSRPYPRQRGQQMSENKEGGGPAFPVSLPGMGDNGAHGMSLRDYFAAAALTGLLNSGLLDEDVPSQAYRFADALLKARQQND